MLKNPPGMADSIKMSAASSTPCVSMTKEQGELAIAAEVSDGEKPKDVKIASLCVAGKNVDAPRGKFSVPVKEKGGPDGLHMDDMVEQTSRWPARGARKIWTNMERNTSERNELICNSVWEMPKDCGELRREGDVCALTSISEEKEGALERERDEMELTEQRTDEPVIFTDKEYETRRMGYSPGVCRIPRDSPRLDHTEIANPLRELLRAGDQWTFAQEKEGKWETQHVKTADGAGIVETIERNHLARNQASFVRGGMLADMATSQIDLLVRRMSCRRMGRSTCANLDC